MIQWITKTILNWVVGPLTDLTKRYFDYKRDKLVVQAGVLTGAIEATAENAEAIARVQMREIRNPWFMLIKLSFMGLALLFFGAHILRAVYFHNWVILDMPPSQYVVITLVTGYLFIAGPASLSELLWAWMIKRK